VDDQVFAKTKLAPSNLLQLQQAVVEVRFRFRFHCHCRCRRLASQAVEVRCRLRSRMEDLPLELVEQVSVIQRT
jgi:hypothetical protein